MRKLFGIVCLLLMTSGMALAQNGTAGPNPGGGSVTVVNTRERADACNLNQNSHSTGATLTLTAGTGGGPQGSIYICSIVIENAQDATGVAAAAPTFITTTGLNGNPQFMVASGTASAGLESPGKVYNFTAPIQSATSGINVTFVLPTFANHQTINLNIWYRLGY